MPIYEYQCGSCGHRLEALQKISDDPLVYCPECNDGALKKLISAAAFHLKGTGWYETDFKNKSSASEEKSDGGSDAKSDAKTDSKSEGGGSAKDPSSKNTKESAPKASDAATTGGNKEKSKSTSQSSSTATQ
ncbi:MAG: zinc ribbon domain-containing protein [Pseudomonadota bacterium]